MLSTIAAQPGMKTKEKPKAVSAESMKARRRRCQWEKQIQLTSVVVVLLLVSSLTSSCKHEKYDSIRDAQDWQNPFLIIQGNGVTVVSQDERVLVPVDKLQEYLTNLPGRNWPYGKIVGIADASLRSGNDDELIPRNRQAVTQILKSLGIRTKRW